MSANIERINGKASFVSNRKPAWWFLGTDVSDCIVDGAMNVQTALERSNAGFTVSAIPLINPLTGEQETKFFAVCRDDNGAMLSTVSDQYEVINYHQVFDFLDELLGKDGFHYETAGVLDEGKKAFVTANFGEFDLMGSGDVHKTYIGAMASHDKTLAETYKLIETRIVCQNTLNIALREKGTAIKIYHSKQNAEKRKDALALLKSANFQAHNLAERYARLAQFMLEPSQIAEVVSKVTTNNGDKKFTPTVEADTQGIMACFENNDNDTFKQWRGTGYNLLNGIVEHYDHVKNSTSDYQRAKSACLGAGNNSKMLGMKLIEEICADGSVQLVNQPTVYSLPSVTPKTESIDYLSDILADFE